MEYMETRISVRELVEFLEKSGDLDGRYTGRRETKAMQAGSLPSSENSGTDGIRLSCGGAVKASAGPW